MIQITRELKLPIQGRIQLYKSIQQNNIINQWQWDNRHIFYDNLTSYMLNVTFEVDYPLEDDETIDICEQRLYIHGSLDYYSIKEQILRVIYDECEDYLTSEDYHNIERDIEIKISDQEDGQIEIYVKLEEQ